MAESVTESSSSALPEDPSSLTLDSASTTLPSTPPFNRLPPEIREQIWLHTLQPRTIQLHIHNRRKRISSRNPISRRLAGRRGGPTRISAVSFSAAVGPLNAQSFMYASDVDSFRIWSDDMHSRTAAPPGPVALCVCRESREIAQRHYDYEIAFAGVNLERRNGGEEKLKQARIGAAERWLGRLAKKRIWADFDRDEIVMDNPWGLQYVLNEEKKIRRLGKWTARTLSSYDLTEIRSWIPYLPEWTNLKQLSLHVRSGDGNVGKAQEIEDGIMRELERAREEMKEEWLAKLPEVKVVVYNP